MNPSQIGLVAIASSESQTFDHMEDLLSRNFALMEDKQCWFTLDLAA